MGVRVARLSETARGRGRGRERKRARKYESSCKGNK